MQTSFNVGDSVSWTCAPRKGKSFTAKGTITALVKLGFGMKKKRPCARLQVRKGSAYHKCFNRLATVALLSKLTKV